MLNVKTYEGESQELADFVTPIWRESYAGKRLIPDWNAYFFGFIIRGTSGEEYWRRQTGAVTLGELGFWCRVFDVKAVRNCSYMSAFDRWFFSFLPAFQNP